MKTGNFCPSSYKRMQKFPNLRNYIFAILKDNTVKLDLFCQWFFATWPTSKFQITVIKVY